MSRPKPFFDSIDPAQTWGGLLDHLVGGGEQRFGDGEAKGLGGLRVDSQPIFGRCLYWHIAGLGTVEYAVDVPCRLLVLPDQVIPRAASVLQQTTSGDKAFICCNRWYAIALSQLRKERMSAASSGFGGAMTLRRPHAVLAHVGEGHWLGWVERAGHENKAPRSRGAVTS
jgi:hypothetical protein